MISYALAQWKQLASNWLVMNLMPTFYDSVVVHYGVIWHDADKHIITQDCVIMSNMINKYKFSLNEEHI